MSGIQFRAIGRVQGVGFRHFVHQAALRAGVCGWVRNEVDGSVVGEAFAEATVLASFRQALESGPTFSRVDSLEVTALDPGEASLPPEFEIRY